MNRILRNKYFIWLKNLQGCCAFFYFLEQLRKIAWMLVRKFFELIEENLWGAWVHAMAFCDKYQSIYELFLGYIDSWCSILLKVIIHPYSPLIMSSNYYHCVFRLENTEDVNKYFVSYHHFFQEIDYLRERKQFYIA